MANQFAYEGNTIEELAAVETPAGTFAIANGRAKYYSTNGQDSQPTEAGKPISPYVRGVFVWIDKANAGDAFNDNDPVFGSVANQNALTAGGDGQIGRAAEDNTAGTDRVLVEWGAP